MKITPGPRFNRTVHYVYCIAHDMTCTMHSCRPMPCHVVPSSLNVWYFLSPATFNLLYLPYVSSFNLSIWYCSNKCTALTEASSLLLPLCSPSTRLRIPSRSAVFRSLSKQTVVCRVVSWNGEGGASFVGALSYRAL
jgi:hypothetical protein